MKLRSTAEPFAKPARRRGRITDALSLSVTQVLLIAWAILVIFPFVWMVYSSFKTDKEIFFSPWTLPTIPHFDNFARAWNEASIGRYFLNSLVVVLFSLVLTLLLGSMTSYVLARYEFWGNRVIYYSFLLGMTFPVFLAIVPLFFVVRSLGLLGTLPGLVLVYVAYSLPFSVFFLTSFFKTLPTEIGEAGMIDGCSHFGVFFRLMLPLASPGIVSIGIFNFVGMWNQYLLPLVLNPNQDNFVLAQGLAYLSVSQGYQGDWSALFAGLTIAMAPVLVVYVVLQDRLQAGLTVGAIK
jgi:N-acetylglucosamine transport system permease protein